MSKEVGAGGRCDIFLDSGKKVKIFEQNCAYERIHCGKLKLKVHVHTIFL